MKKMFILTALTLSLAVSGFAQGFFNFDNSAIYDGTANSFLPYIGSSGKAGEGTVGAILGSGSAPNYDIGYLFLNGTTFSGQSLTPTAFIGDGASFGSLVASFAAATGDVTDGAGIVEGGTTIPIPSGTSDGQNITIQLIAWYDPTGTTSFTNSLSSAFNVGGSILTTIRLAQGSDPNVADLSTIHGFAVNPVPEPTTLALAGLGGAALLAFRRRKV